MERKLASGISLAPAPPVPAEDLDLGAYVPYLLHQAHRALIAIFTRDLARAGVSLAEWRVLSVLHHQGAVRFGALAAASGLEPPTLVRVLSALEERDFVRRRRRAEDRRSTLVEPMAAGLDLARRLVPAARRLETKALAGLTAREAASLRRLLGRVRANVAGAEPGEEAE